MLGINPGLHSCHVSELLPWLSLLCVLIEGRGRRGLPKDLFIVHEVPFGDVHGAMLCVALGIESRTLCCKMCRLMHSAISRNVYPTNLPPSLFFSLW